MPDAAGVDTVEAEDGVDMGKRANHAGKYGQSDRIVHFASPSAVPANSPINAAASFARRRESKFVAQPLTNPLVVARANLGSRLRGTDVPRVTTLRYAYFTGTRRIACPPPGASFSLSVSDAVTLRFSIASEKRFSVR